jgi:pantoate--beta-alanine ligase
VKIVTQTSVLQKTLRSLRRKGRTIGFVPTMGCLHEGHLSLVRRARRENDIVVVSIFVNPLQFGPREDLKTYPRQLPKDIRLLRGSCDIVFAPSRTSFYPEDFSTFVEVRGLSDRLCGHSRPGHFRGVATVVAKLFCAASPDRAYFGQKDAQQVAVIQKMCRDLGFPLDLKVCPIVREKDGLAMSSRNLYLTPSERRDAVVLFQALKSGQHLAAQGQRDAARIVRTLEDFIRRTRTAKIDYIAIVDPLSFEPVKTIARQALLLLAVFIGKTRLIDNAVLKVT